MVRSENFGFRLSPEEKALLLLVCERKERTAADVLRRLIRQEAQRSGLLPPTDEQAHAGRELSTDG